MIVIHLSVILIARDIAVALIVVVLCWLFSVLLRCGTTFEGEWKVLSLMLAVALVVLLFKWGVVVVL